MGTLKELTPEMLARFTQIDYDCEMALVALIDDGGRERQIAVVRYITNADRRSAEFAIVVAEPWQGQGLGRHLMLQLIGIARAHGLDSLEAQVLAANPPMLELATGLGFVVGHTDPREKSVRLAL
jgi:acetyltransferase